ncbi:MAG: hypothetical protein ACT6Q5_02710 [Sphingopyxis solisilvae]
MADMTMPSSRSTTALIARIGGDHIGTSSLPAKMPDKKPSKP